MSNDSPFPPGSSLAYYLRASSSRQELSVPRQESIVLEWMQENGYAPGRAFRDVKSGISTIGRAAFEAMIEYFHRPGFPEIGLILFEYNRLSRSFDDSAYYLADLRRRGIQVYSLTDKIPEGPIGRVVESLYLWQSEDERLRLGMRVASGQRYVAERYHSFPSPRVPVGYSFDPEMEVVGHRRDGRPRYAKRLVPDPETAPRVRRAFVLRAQGRTFEEIQSELRLPITTQTYSKIFRNEIYLGILNWNEARIENFCEPLVDLSTWARVQEINNAWQKRATNHKFGNPRLAASPYLLAGMVHCAVCGSLMYGAEGTRFKKNVYLYYRCNDCHWLTVNEASTRSIRADYLEPIVIEYAVAHLANTPALWDAYQEARGSAGGYQAEYLAQQERIKTELKDVARGIANITTAIKDAGHSIALLKELASLEEREIELRRRLSKLSMDAAPVLPELDEAGLQALSGKILTELEMGEFRERQLILRSLIYDIRVRHEKKKEPEIEIVFYPLFVVQ